MKPNCLECRFYSDWEQPSGGCTPRCSEHPELEVMVREELTYYVAYGRWAGTWEVIEEPHIPGEEEDSLDDDTAVLHSIREWMDARLVRIDTEERPIYRTIGSIMDDVLWKFQRCSDFARLTDEEAEREAVHVDSFHTAPHNANDFPREENLLEPLEIADEPLEEIELDELLNQYRRRERNLAGYVVKAAREGKPIEPVLRLWDAVKSACP